MRLLSSHNMQQIVFALFLMSACVVYAAEEATNKTETDPEVPAVPEETEVEEAEFRQGLSALAGYPSAYGGANQFAMTGSGGSGYVNMLRNLYRPPSIGLTDKVKHWVKSFMNRRQYVKPYYNPSSLQYSADEFGAASKPVFLSGNSYKAISVPLRQLQKYYKPYYPEQQASGSNSLLNYGLYSPSSAGLYSAGTGGGAGSSAFSAAASSPGTSQLFAGSSPGTSQLFAGSSPGTSQLFAGNSYGGSSFGGSSYGGSNAGASQLFAGNGQGASQLFAGSDSLFSQGEGPTSALFSAGGLYGTGGSQGSYQPSSAGGSSIYSIDSSSLYGSSDGSSAYYGASSSGSGSPSDLYASGANPVPSIYNPGAQGKKASESALYMPDQRNAGKETVASSSFSVDSGRNSNGPQSSFSQFQGSNSGFQPVSFAS